LLFDRPAGLQVMAPSSQSGFSAMEEAHLLRECRPCAYFYFKADGCRKGHDCEFCHLCDKSEAKRRKKARVKLFRDEDKRAAQTVLVS